MKLMTVLLAVHRTDYGQVLTSSVLNLSDLLSLFLFQIDVDISTTTGLTVLFTDITGQRMII